LEDALLEAMDVIVIRSGQIIRATLLIALLVKRLRLSPYWTTIGRDEYSTKWEN